MTQRARSQSWSWRAVGVALINSRQESAAPTCSRRWTPFLSPFSYQQTDPINQIAQVLSSARLAAEELKQSLAKRSRKSRRAAEELRQLWADPVQRLLQVAAAEGDLQALLAADGDKEGGGGGENHDWADTASEYSLVSLKSDRSQASKTSTSSGMSTVSVLSAASRSSAASTSTKSSSFSIVGLDHALLSRGSANDGAWTKRDSRCGVLCHSTVRTPLTLLRVGVEERKEKRRRRTIPAARRGRRSRARRLLARGETSADCDMRRTCVNPS